MKEEYKMVQIIQSLFIGMSFGALVAYFKLPVPAPAAFVGVVAIFGIYIGYSIMKGDFQ